jgi:putative transposase
MLAIILRRLISALRTQQGLAIENLAQRHQLNLLQRTVKRPQLRGGDRFLWELSSRSWEGWRNPLTFVQPETVIRWHREGLRIYWRWKSRPKRSGRPKVANEIRELIGQMSEANPLWGAPHIHGELLKLGIEISQAAVYKYMIRKRKPPLLNWRTFLENHANDIVSIAFFTVPTVTFRVLFVFVMLSNVRRRVIHFNVTAVPNGAWTGQRMVEAFPWDTWPRFLLRDRDGAYGKEFRRRVAGMEIEEAE